MSWSNQATIPADAELIATTVLREMLPANVKVVPDFINVSPTDTAIVVSRIGGFPVANGLRDQVNIMLTAVAPSKEAAWDVIASACAVMYSIPKIGTHSCTAVVVMNSPTSIPVEHGSDGAARYRATFYMLVANQSV